MHRTTSLFIFENHEIARQELVAPYRVRVQHDQRAGQVLVSFDVKSGHLRHATPHTETSIFFSPLPIGQAPNFVHVLGLM